MLLTHDQVQILYNMFFYARSHGKLMAELSHDSMSWMIFRWHLQVRDRWLTYPLGVPTLGPCRYVGKRRVWNGFFWICTLDGWFSQFSPLVFCYQWNITSQPPTYLFCGLSKNDHVNMQETGAFWLSVRNSEATTWGRRQCAEHAQISLGQT